MPPQKWTSERNERLLLLVIKDVRLDYKKLETAWKDRYGDQDDFMPTARAINEQYKALCKRAGLKDSTGDGSLKTTPRSTPVKATAKFTPRKGTPVKTPTSNKRKARSMSDEDDSEDEKAIKCGNENIAPRAKSQRRSKTPKTYRESEDDDTEAEVLKQEGGGDGAFSVGVNNTGENGNGVDLDAMSDFSSFEPDL